MKKLLPILLIITVVFMFSACGGSDESSAPQNTDQNTEQAEEAADSGEAEEASSDSEAASEPVEEVPEFEEITVVDNDECTIKITGLDPDGFWGYTLDTYLENKSEDKTYMFSVISASVNGVESDPFFATEVAAGKKKNDSISFLDDSLKNNGVGDITDLEMTFKVYNSDDWSDDDAARETVQVYPLGEDKATKFKREDLDSDTVLVDNDNIKVVVTGYEDDSIWGYSVNLYLENKTDEELMYAVDDVSVNGFMADPFWAKSVGPGKVAFTSMSFSDSDFEENSITEVNEIEMKFKVYDSEEWSDDNVYSDTITLKP